MEQVTHPQVVARFILPELWAVAPEDRRRLLQHVREHWGTLKQEQAVVDTLKQVQSPFATRLTIYLEREIDRYTYFFKEAFLFCFWGGELC